MADRQRGCRTLGSSLFDRVLDGLLRLGAHACAGRRPALAAVGGDGRVPQRLQLRIGLRVDCSGHEPGGREASSYQRAPVDCSLERPSVHGRHPPVLVRSEGKEFSVGHVTSGLE